VVSAVTLLALLGYGVGRLFLGKEWPAGFATTSILILLSLSLNALFLGVIGEYVGRIYQQVRRRPLTIIEHRLDRAPLRGRAEIEHDDDVVAVGLNEGAEDAPRDAGA
jgi:dolichol-phosphate mannosyltransferase